MKWAKCPAKKVFRRLINSLCGEGKGKQAILKVISSNITLYCLLTLTVLVLTKEI